MFKKKCPNCKEKVERKFLFCPYCGISLKKKETAEDFGMLGKDDTVQQAVNQMNLPFGLNGIVNNLMKQLESEMGSMGGNPAGMPKGFKIQISTGKPGMNMIPINPQQQISQANIPKEEISDKEKIRRAGLKKVVAKSSMRRLPEGIVYEIDAPGVKAKKDVSITKLAQGIEVKAYSQDKCFVKTIPLKVDILNYVVKDEKVFLVLKG
jgi:hypothetical protein